MGSFYTNITLRGPDLDPVLAYLDAHTIVAYVAAPQPGYVVIYDQASESQDEAILTARAAQLSREFICPAFVVLNHDDDVLTYWLYENGMQIDTYNSAPGWSTGEDSPPSGGNAAILCRVFGVDAAQAPSIEEILRREDDSAFGTDLATELMNAARNPERWPIFLRRALGLDPQEEMSVEEMMQRWIARHQAQLVCATDRHDALVKALHLPDCTVGFGFDTIHNDDLPDDLTDDDRWLTGPEA